MSNGSSQTYRISPGCGDEHHLKEINAFASQGYRALLRCCMFHQERRTTSQSWFSCT